MTRSDGKYCQQTYSSDAVELLGDYSPNGSRFGQPGRHDRKESQMRENSKEDAVSGDVRCPSARAGNPTSHPSFAVSSEASGPKPREQKRRDKCLHPRSSSRPCASFTSDKSALRMARIFKRKPAFSRTIPAPRSLRSLRTKPRKQEQRNECLTLGSSARFGHREASENSTT
ncbi:hypothetical protein BU16DRAFT_557452 [Lophium mytilinum]|uniref:Uncharacterized protein n=1 Tax=Lophium mytilinum TaxID=390894 RepID=A0A6A6R2W3_9PEZI|nr:hypothetical protein BU16DRAFT_557452 [Lophium mytilinum]